MVEIKNRKCIKFANSIGFVIPIQYNSENMQDGIKLGSYYNISLTPVESDDGEA